MLGSDLVVVNDLRVAICPAIPLVEPVACSAVCHAAVWCYAGQYEIPHPCHPCACWWSDDCRNNYSSFHTWRLQRTCIIDTLPARLWSRTRPAHVCMWHRNQCPQAGISRTETEE